MKIRSSVVIGAVAAAFLVTTAVEGAQATPAAKPAGQTAKSTGAPQKPAAPAGTSKAAPKKSAPAGAKAAPKAAASKAALRNPASLKAVAPPTYNAVFNTSVGEFVILVHRDWAPTGADRFYNLVKNGYYDDTRIFRAIRGFMVQFGINGDPSIQRGWMEASITDDPVKQSNKRGFVTFAKSGAPNSRTTQVFINFADNSRLDPDGFAPFGEVVSGMDVVDKLYSEYGESASRQQGRIQAEGNKFLDAEYPKLDSIKTATIVTTPVTKAK